MYNHFGVRSFRGSATIYISVDLDTVAHTELFNITMHTINIQLTYHSILVQVEMYS